MLLLESTTTFPTSGEHTHLELDNLCIDFSNSPSAALDLLKGDPTRTRLILPTPPIPELNDFNIAQVQMEYESNADMDNSLNTIHSLTSIDLLNDHNDIEDPDYDARRMSSSAISSASAHSAHSVHTSSTAATSHSGFSQGIKRSQSPGVIDDFDSYDAFKDSPRVKRPRPSLSLEPGSIRLGSASPAPTNTTASAGGNSADASSNGNANGTSRVQLPPLFSALENTSSSAPPTSHGSQTPFAMHSDTSQMQQSHHHHHHHQHHHQQAFSQSHGPSQGQTSPFPTGSFAFNVTGTGLDLRRGSLPSLYSNSLAARYAQRVPSQDSLLGQAQAGSRYGFNTNSTSSGMGMSPGPSPLSSLSAPPMAGSANDANSGLAGYQFPAPSGSDSGHGSNGSGSTPTPTANTSTSAPGASPFGSGMTPTSTLSSAPSSGFPQTPLDFSQQSGSSSSSNYHHVYSQQNQNQKEYDRLTNEYLNTGNDWGSIARPASTPSSAVNTPASANPSGGFGFTSSSGGLGGLPRISGHSKNNDSQQQQEWFTSTGQLILPSPSTNAGSSPSSSQSQRQQQPQQASLSPSPRMHTSSSGGGSSASASAAAAAAAAAAALNVSPAAAVQAAQVAAQVAARPARRRGKLPKPTTDFLKDWLHRHSDHPYPSEEEKKQLCHATGLSMSQVSNWMINARRRILAPAQRNQQGPTTTVPSFSLGGSNANVSRTPLGLSPTGHLSSSHHHHQQHMSHSQSSGYGGGMSMSASMSGIGLGLIGTNGHGLGGMNGIGGGGSHSMGYPHQQQHHQHSLHTTAQGLGMASSGMYAPQQYRTHHQQQQQQLGHGGLYDIGHLHAQRRASMPTLALHSSHSHSPLSNTGVGGAGSLQLYPSSSTPATRNSLPGPSPLPQIGYTSTYSPQPGSSSMSGSGAQQMIGLGTAGTPPAPTPQRGYVFPPPQAGGSSGGSDGGR